MIYFSEVQYVFNSLHNYPIISVIHAVPFTLLDYFLFLPNLAECSSLQIH